MMKRFLLSIFLCGFFASGSSFALVDIPELTSPVIDTTGTLSEKQIASVAWTSEAQSGDRCAQHGRALAGASPALSRSQRTKRSATA